MAAETLAGALTDIIRIGGETMPEAPEKNLALDIVRITEAAALSSARWLGRGNKEAGDGAAVDAMRNSFSTLHVDGIVVIGEGEKDHAPMLYNGESVGMGDGPQLDVAVDPVEGTSLLAYGRPNAISTVAVAPRGSMFNPGPSYYMQKLVVAREARDVIDLDAPVAVNLNNVARALGGWEKMVNPNAKDKQTLALLDALVDWQKEDKLFENQQLFLTPIVRNGRKATVGYQPDVWKTWE